MALNKKYLRITAILGMIFSLVIFIIAIVYAFIGSLGVSWIITLITIAMIEVVAFTVSLFLAINPKSRIFFTGLITLFAGLVPGIMILSFYFRTKKILLKNFELDS